MSTFIDIIDKALARLKEKMHEARKFSAGERSLPLTHPSVRAYIGPVEFEPHGQEGIYVKPVLNLLMEFKSARGERERLAGVSAMVEAAVAVLALQDLGLEIDELVPTGAREVTTKGDDRAGKAVFLLSFRTGFVMEKQEDDAAVELLKLGFDLYLQEPSDDGQPDLETVVDYNT